MSFSIGLSNATILGENEVNETTKLTFKCNITGHPKPNQFQWYKVDDNDKKTKIGNGTNTYVVQNATSVYSGKYKCNGTNAWGSKESNEFVMNVLCK